MVPGRERHPKKDVEKALRFGEEAGWVVSVLHRGHRWGTMVCRSGSCAESVWSTPKNPTNHAKR
jgi:hypothetical protein